MTDERIRELIRMVFPGSLTVREQLLLRGISVLEFESPRVVSGPGTVYGRLKDHLGERSRISLNPQTLLFEMLITFGHELAHHIADWGIERDKVPISGWASLRTRVQAYCAYLGCSWEKYWEYSEEGHYQKIADRVDIQNERLCDRFSTIWLAERTNRNEVRRLIFELSKRGNALDLATL